MTLIKAIEHHFPNDMQMQNLYLDEYVLTEIQPNSALYTNLARKVVGPFNLGIEKIVRICNPYLYGQFLLKKEEYKNCCSAFVKELFHDTAAHNIHSIASGNLDWRRATRVKYGRGVSFTPSPGYANKQSSRSNGTNRAMILADVLVGVSETVISSQDLPSSGYDTTVGNCNNVYVKYYDNEFYPKYVIYYTSNLQHFRRRYYTHVF